MTTLPARTSSDLPALWQSDEPNATPQFDLRRGLRIGGGLMALLLVMAAFVPIGGAVIGNGQVGVESRVKRIAHPFGGVIAEILVANGEHVKKGQLLMRLDDKVSGAGATYSSLTVEQLLAQKARLETERLGAGTIRFPAELLAMNSDSAAKAMADERRLFAMRNQEQAQMQAQLSARIMQFDNEIVSLRAQITSMQRQRTLIEPERQGVKELWEKDLVTINRLNQMERTAAEIDGRIASLNAEIAKSHAQIAETRERMIQMVESRRVEAGAELTRVLTALNEQRVKSIAAGDQQVRSEIHAPYSGTVEKIAFAAVGEVVRPAEPIMEIVPDSDEMVVEAAISPADIDQVRQGQTARVRFSAFNVAATPEIDGKVIYAAADRTVQPETGQAFFMVRIAIDQTELRRENLKLTSGMPAEVHIHTGNRSMLSYVTKPLRDQFARAFRDN